MTLITIEDRITYRLRSLHSISASLGYDDAGNAPHLLTEADKAILEAGTWVRVGSKGDCAVCGEAYWLHPDVQGALWLKRACTGLVKL